jgi:5-methyltetrahydrofolate--homocysteine methyltransferase
MARNEQLYQAVYKGDQKTAEEVVLKALEDGEDVAGLLEESLIPAMKQIGDDFECGEAFVPEMLIAARTMSKALAHLKPLLGLSGIEPKGKICIGTVKGDLHDIGKNLVGMMLEGAGYEVEDLGVDCAPEKFEEAVDRGATFVMLSALLTTTMPVMKDIVEYLKAKYPEVHILIGGAPISQEYSDSIGADGYGATASQAVTLVEGLVAQ